MLGSVTVYSPFRLDTDAEQSVVIESLFPVDPIFHATLRFVNKTAGSNIQIIIDQTETLGLSSDPMYTGSSTVNLLTQTTVPGQVVFFEFTPKFLTFNAVYKPVLSHNIRLKNLATTPLADDIVSISLYGISDDVVSQSRPVLPTRVPVIF